MMVAAQDPPSPGKAQATGELNSDLVFPEEDQEAGGSRSRQVEQVMMGQGVGLGSLLSSSLFDS